MNVNEYECPVCGRLRKATDEAEDSQVCNLCGRDICPGCMVGEWCMDCDTDTEEDWD